MPDKLNALLFLIEILLGGVVPLVMLAMPKVRETPSLLGIAAFLSMGGIIFNRINVVLFAVNLPGPIPQVASSTYVPAWVEWALPLGLVAATVLLISLGSRFLPVLSKEEGDNARA